MLKVSSIGTVFFKINGYKLNASEVDATITFENLASDALTESELSLWFEKHSIKI